MQDNFQIEIDDNLPFSHSSLDREQYADILAQIISIHHNGAVISLNGKWGAGKTTFVKMWMKKYETTYQTIFFNAWESDFVSDPLVAIIGELASYFSSNKEITAKIKEFLTKFAKRLPYAFTKDAVKFINQKYFNISLVNTADACKTSALEAFQPLASEVDQYNDEKKTLTDFSTALEGIIASVTTETPLVFFVDELDRCNPHFAVKVLERIKHLFTIKKIVFVLSVDKEQLCHAIRGYYGSDRFDAEDYLRRFIDLEYNLPEPDGDLQRYIYDLFTKLHIPDNEDLTKMLESLFHSKHLTLRQMERLMYTMSLSLRTKPMTGADQGVMLLLLYIKQHDHVLYTGMKQCTLSVQQLVDEIETLFRDAIIPSYTKQVRSSIFFKFCVVNLICTYYRNDQENVLPRYNSNSQDNPPLFFNSQILDAETIKKAINAFNNLIPISSYCSQIDLLQKLIQ